jgi:hypothetical protein
MAEEFFCWVQQAGASMQGTDTPKPEVLFLLNDAAGSFQDAWFYAPEPAKNQMLAVALAALANQYQVHVFVDPPQPGGGPAVQCYNIYLVTP